MKKFKFNKQALRVLFVGTALVGVLFMNSVSFAATKDTLETLHTKDFIEWQKLSNEEKEKILMPKMYTTITGQEKLEQFDQKFLSYRMQILTRKISTKLYTAMMKSATYNSPAYNLNKDVKVKVKHQGSTNECWAFSTITALETNLALTQNVEKEFSPRHMDYSTSKTFTDGINSYGFNREVGMGGITTFGLAYLTNGKGAVLESEMPFEDNEEKISLKELEKPVDTIVTDFVSLPILMKEYDSNGNITYTNGGEGANRKVYKSDEVVNIRNIIKNHIVKYGAVTSVTAGNYPEFYDNKENPFKSKAYFCNTNSKTRDHAVTIVGWDDTYSKNNFTGAAKPKSDGAYICLNTYGAESFENGYLYISYEDALIESYLYGISTSAKVDYDNLYQYNIMGDNTAIGMSSVRTGYIANIFDRDKTKNETINYVGISVPDDVSLEIYINPNGKSATLNSLTKIATTEVLEPGYHRIKVNETKLTGDNYVIVVKQTSAANRFYFSIEASVPNSLYSTVKGNPGKSLYSLDGYTWRNLSKEIITGFDMGNTDLCIKAFTKYTNEPVEKPNDNDNNNNNNDNNNDNNNNNNDNSNDNNNNNNDNSNDNNNENSNDNNNNNNDNSNDNNNNNNNDNSNDNNNNNENNNVNNDNDNTNNDNDKEEKITLSTKEYLIKDKDIYKIPRLTTCRTLKSKFTTNSKEVIIKDKNGNSVKDNEKIKTGMKMILSDKSEYTLIVRGDIDGCGDVTIVDFSKFIAHYGYGKEYKLEGDALKAADMNYDSKIEIIDVSQMVDLYMNI